jgi:hypothetical protein
MLRFEPATESIGISVELERIDSLLSQGRYRDSLQLAQQTLLKFPEMDANDRIELAVDKAIAEAHLHKAKEALKDLEVSMPAVTEDPQEKARRDMAVSEVSLEAGLAQAALDAATTTAAQFKSAGLLDSELRSACLGASAAKLTGNSTAFAAFSSEVVDIVTKIQQTWTPQASQTYFSRPDLQVWMRQNHLGPVPDRR